MVSSDRLPGTLARRKGGAGAFAQVVTGSAPHSSEPRGCNERAAPRGAHRLYFCHSLKRAVSSGCLPACLAASGQGRGGLRAPLGLRGAGGGGEARPARGEAGPGGGEASALD